MIYQLSKRTIEYIAARSNQNVDQDQLDVYIYGLECFINTAVPVVLLTIFSILHDSLFETWLWIPAAILYFLCMGTAVILCPIKSAKKRLSYSQRMLYKYYTLGIMTFFFLMSLFLPSSFAASLSYSVFCCMLLVIIEIMPRKLLVL